MEENKHSITEEEDCTTYNHVIKYTGIFGGVQGITMLMGLVRNKLVALLLGTSGAALINIFNSSLKLTNDSTNFGIPFSAVKHIAEIHETGDMEAVRQYARVVRTWTLCTGLVGMLIMMLLSAEISRWTFGDTGNAGNFMLLAPAVAFLSVSAGELSILKGTKKLKNVAVASVYSSIAAVALCIPIYYYIGLSGIVYSLLATTLSVMCIQLYFCNKVIPWRVSPFQKDTYSLGAPMVKLGLGYIIAGVFGQGAEYIIRVLILNWGCLEDVGLYHSGYVMAVTYASMVFIAIEADYFPRLSSIKHDTTRQNATVNQQIEVCALLISPILILFVVAMPLIVVVLFSNKFMDAVPMAICASFYMYFKALTLPAAYLSLAHGDSKIYMLTELIYDIYIASVIPLSYRYFGLVGTGLALSSAGLLDAVIIHTLYRKLYSFRFCTRLGRFYVIQYVLLTASVIISFTTDGAERYVIGAMILLVSLLMSLRILRRDTNIVSQLTAKIKEKLRKK